MTQTSNKLIYRIEKIHGLNGMWYDKNGQYDPVINEICPNALAKDIPMDHDEIHRKDNKVWQSAGKSIDNMNKWFSREDAINLLKNDFKLYEMKVKEFIELEMEILFTRQGILERKEIPIDEVWKN
ncbi:hypothetical protein M0813_19229 [Anaeramoeba flamelloides]|uniref:Uncharacterized protein n=1 Tax=Anaeramoeba flamelloides TaxID=1746091 RepID=A0ABQ8YPM7_9EUKA|nr:hypothetical protein M0813_19229 [Anaeramoeba flamelloides]